MPAEDVCPLLGNPPFLDRRVSSCSGVLVMRMEMHAGNFSVAVQREGAAGYPDQLDEMARRCLWLFAGGYRTLETDDEDAEADDDADAGA